MNLSYLSDLVSGINPEEEGCRILNAHRKNRVEKFIKQIPENYSMDSIRSDIERLESTKGSRLYKFVEYFFKYAIVATIVIFVIYWFFFGFWRALLTGIVLMILSYFLDKNIGSLVDLSSDSEKLLCDFDDLVNGLIFEQKKENAKKQ